MIRPPGGPRGYLYRRMKTHPRAAEKRPKKIRKFILQAMAKKITCRKVLPTIGITDGQMRLSPERREDPGNDGPINLQPSQPSDRRY
jgi:hypothetical protein